MGELRTPSFRLDGRRAIVAGGTGAIGYGCAVALAENGADVLVVSRRSEAIEETVAKLGSRGFRARGMVLDITDFSAITTVFETHGPFDIAVNSAGVANPKPALDTSDTEFDSLLKANTHGAFAFAREAARGMRVLGGGTIIQISSQMGLVGGTDRVPYCASKHALEGMSKAMAIEWGTFGIRVNTICPTFIRTALTAPTFENPERVAWIKSKIKLDRIGEVTDIMGAVQFLASDASAMITGTHIVVDGGWIAG